MRISKIIAGESGGSDRKDQLDPVTFFVTWLIVLNLSMFKFFKQLDFTELPCGMINSPFFATLMFFLWFVAPLLFLLGLRGRKTWLVVFFTGAALILQSFALASPCLDEAVDRDEAIRLGIEQIKKGESPYLARTTKGLPLSPWPGAMLIGFPSYLVFGRGDGFNPALLILLALLAYRRVRLSRWSICLPVLLLLSYPTLHCTIWGSTDFLYPAVFLALFVELASRDRPILGAVALALALTCRTATSFILGVPLVFLLALKEFREEEQSLTRSIIIGIVLAVGLSGIVFLMDPSAMIDATLLPGSRKLGYESANYLIKPFHFVRDTWRPGYPFLLLSLILTVQTVLVFRNRRILGALLAQVSGLLMMCFFYIPDWANPSKYLGLPVVLAIYSVAYGFSIRTAPDREDAIQHASQLRSFEEQ